MSSDRLVPVSQICTSSLQVLLQCLVNNMQLPLVIAPMDSDGQPTKEIECLLSQIRLLRDLYGELQLLVPCVSGPVQRELIKVLLSELD
jgi:hypothetical protein